MSRLTLDEEVELLRRYASAATLGVVEIGCYDGETTAELCRAANGVAVYGIDPIVPDKQGNIGSLESIHQNTAFYPGFVFLKKKSHDAARDWVAPVDFVFVDGDHDYQVVMQDCTDWFDLLADGGYIAFHDAAKSGRIGFVGAEGPMRLTDKLIQTGLELVEQVGTTRVFHKAARL